ncbi:MAG: type IV pilus biogenesis/stability protein PilW [Pseudomonadota bacterium]
MKLKWPLGLGMSGLMLVLAGCAGSGGPAASSGAAPRTDVVTESDQTDARRRARLRLALATGYFEQGQTEVALDELKQAIVIDPTFAEALNLRGLVYMRLNDLPLAEDSFRRALVLDPRDADAAHNYGWLLCQQSRFAESTQQFERAVEIPGYTNAAKSLMAQGICQIRAGNRVPAEKSLVRSYELDAGNPVTGYNLASLMLETGQLARAQFYVRRINNSPLANAETLWLGIKIERKLDNREAMTQLGNELRRGFAQSPQRRAYDRGAFDE